MKKFLFSLLTLAAALTVASCQKELQAGPNGEGPAVNASFAVSLGDAMTKAFADGTTVDKVYAALYEVDSDGAYKFVAEADPAEIKDRQATVQINGKLKKGKSYRVAFWAQKAAEAAAEGSTTAPAASAYSVVWDPAPVVTVTPEGAANDEARDAFYGVYDIDEVTGNITAEKVIPLVRPFAQVNVLVPVGNLSADAAITSSMTIKQAPTTLNLNTGETGTPGDYVFATAPMAEPAFGAYTQTHRYVAMNYVLVDQNAQSYHNVEFSVTAGDDSTGETPKSLNVPLKANVRTNIVGNIFESYGFNGTVVITPGGSEVEATDIRIAVGTAGTSSEDPVEVSPNGSLVTFAISRSVAGETPTISYDREGVVTAEWVSESNGINILPQVENGSAVVTVMFPEVTKTTYAEGKVDVYVKVGSGENPVVDPTITVSDAPAEPVSEAFDLTVTTNSSGAVTAALTTAEGAATSAATIEKKSGPTESEGNYVWVFTVTPANDLSDDASVVATFTVAEVANAFNEGSETASFTVSKAAGGGDTPTDVTTIADIKNGIGTEQDEGDEFNAVFSNVIVTYVNGQNAYIEDETGGLLVYASGHGLVAGTTLSGSATLKGKAFNGLQEVTTFTKGEDFTATEGATIPVTTVTVAELKANFAQYESRRVKLEGVVNETAIKANKTSISITQGNETYVLRTQAELKVEVPANSNFDVIGYPATFKTDTQFSVWSYDDFTINSSGDIQPTISGMADQSLKPGESYTFAATTTNPNGTVVYSIVSGNDVVDLDGAEVTVKSTAAVGATAVIKAFVAATTGYLAAEETATITVKAAGSTTETKSVEFTAENSGGITTTGGAQTGKIDDITVSLGNGAVNTGNGDIRIYKNNKMTISAESGCTITKIVITSKSNDVSGNGPAKFGTGAPSNFSISTDGTTGTWTGSESSVDFTATDAQVRMISIAVTYEK